MIPTVMVVVMLILSAGILDSARRTTDKANARLLGVVGALATFAHATPEPLADYVQGMPVPKVYGSKREFKVFESDGRITVYAMETETTGFLFDPSTDSFAKEPVTIVDAGNEIAA
jgi:hypothetical protein